MKTNRFLALLLALAMVCTMLAGCGKKEEPVEHVKLSRGAYEAYDDEDDLAGYLVVAKGELTAYDEDGELDETYEFDYDSDTTVYMIDDEEAFYVDENDDEELILTTNDGDVYRLEEIEEEDIPGLAEDDNTVSSDEPAADAPAAPTEEAPAAPEETTPVTGESAELDTWGNYDAYQDGQYVGNLDLWGDTVYEYDADGTTTGTYSIVELGNGSYEFTDQDTNETIVFTVTIVDGELRLGSGSDYVVLVDTSTSGTVSPSTPATGTDLSGSVTTTELARFGSVSVKADIPVEWAEVAESSTDSDSATFEVNYTDASSNSTMLMVAMGNKSDIPANTLDDLATAMKDEILSDYADSSAAELNEDTVRQAGVEWYVTDLASTDSGISYWVGSCSAIIDDQACILLIMHYGTTESIDQVRSATDELFDSITIS